MKKILSFIIICILSNSLRAQKEFYNWHLGEGVQVRFDDSGNAVTGTSNVRTNEGTAAVSDCEGNLLFYTNGETVWNSNNSVMENGTNLDGFTGNTSPAIIVKKPGSSNIYYIFTTSGTNGLKYSIVNMSGDNSRGRVIEKNIFLDNKSTGKLGVTYHANGTDIWVITHYSDNNEYEAFLINENGFERSVSSLSTFVHSETHGDLTVSQDGRKIASCIDELKLFPNSSVILADFNNSTGQITNEARIQQSGSPHGCEFSPNNNYLYVNSTSSGIVQYNMNAGSNISILQSRRSISGSSSVYGSLRLGPNGVIYVADFSSNFLGIINNAETSFASYRETGLSLRGGTKSGYGIINTTLASPPSYNGPNSVNYSPTCFGDIVDFSLDVESNIQFIQWDFDDPASGFFNNSNLLNPQHEFTQPGTYNVSVEITYDCGSEVINIPVLINEIPIVNFPDTVIVCSDEFKNIGINNPNSNYFYQWSPGVNLSNTNTSNPVFNGSSSSEITYINYSINITSGLNGCLVKDSLVVELVSPIVDAGPNVNVCNEDSVIIGTENRAEYTYSWSPTSNVVNPINGVTKFVGNNTTSVSQLTILELTASYKGCSSSETVSITQNPLPILLNPNQFEVCSNEQININPNFANHTYLWTDNINLSDVNSNNPVFSYNNTSGKDSLFKEVVNMTSLLGCTNIDTAEVLVHPRSGINDYQYLCPGFGAQLNPYGDGVSYIWTPDYNISSTTIKNPIINPDVSTTYYLSVTDIYNCSYQDSIFVEVSPIVPVSLPNDTTICYGDSILIGDISFSENSVFNWSPITNLSNVDSNFTYLYPKDTTKYYLTMTIDTCTGTDSIIINVAQLPKVEILSDTSICYGDSVTLFSSGAIDYIWLNQAEGLFYNDSAVVFPKDTTSYFLSGTDSLGCVNVDTAVVIVWALPTIGNLNDTSMCFGDSVLIKPFASNGIYSWTPTDLVSNPNSKDVIINSPKDTLFSFKVTDDNNCFLIDTFKLQVNPLPVIRMTSDSLVCEGNNAFIWASGGVGYEWTPNPTINPFNSVENRFLIPINEETIFKVIVTTEFGCIDSANSTISVNTNPEANFNYTLETECSGFKVNFVDSSFKYDELIWFFGDGKISTDKNPTNIFSFGNNYTTQLVVGNNSLCYDTAKVDFYFEKLKDFIVVTSPNIITPNGDKINECFEYEINGDFEDCTKLEVFNRWGMKVFDSDDFNGCFNGINRYNNQELSDGTYFFIISVNDYKKNGFIQVTR